MGTPTPLFLTAGGIAASTGPRARATTIMSPIRPSRCRSPAADQLRGDQWKPWLVRDQRFVSDRTDVLSYTTAPLTKAVHIMGPPQVELFAATSGTRQRLGGQAHRRLSQRNARRREPGLEAGHVRLELPIGIEIFRGRYVDSFAKPRAAKGRQGRALSLGLPNVNHVFLPGHRIMVQVQSSLFPLYDRNPQTFVPNIFYAKPGDYRKATQSVFHGGSTASAVCCRSSPSSALRPARARRSRTCGGQGRS